MVLGPLLRDERLPGRHFKDATLHEIAGLLIGQQERVIRLLEAQNSPLPALADKRTYAANDTLKIYTAPARVRVKLTHLTGNIAAAGTVSLLMRHPTTGPTQIPVFTAQLLAVDTELTPLHEFILPQDAELFVTTNQAGDIAVSASVYDASEPALIMNFEL